MGLHREMYKPIPPAGLKEDYLGGVIPITALMQKYHISNTLIYKYINKLGWNESRITNQIERDGKAFKHLTGKTGTPPPIPSFAEVIADLCNFPKHWRGREFTRRDVDMAQENCYHLHLPRF